MARMVAAVRVKWDSTEVTRVEESLVKAAATEAGARVAVVQAVVARVGAATVVEVRGVVLTAVAAMAAAATVAVALVK